MLHLGLWECYRVRNKVRVSSISRQSWEVQRRHTLYPCSSKGAIAFHTETSCHPGVPVYHVHRTLYGSEIYTVVSKMRLLMPYMERK